MTEIHFKIEFDNQDVDGFSLADLTLNVGAFTNLWSHHAICQPSSMPPVLGSLIIWYLINIYSLWLRDKSSNYVRGIHVPLCLQSIIVFPQTVPSNLIVIITTIRPSWRCFFFFADCYITTRKIKIKNSIVEISQC